MSLFVLGDFVLHSGGRSRYKIDCRALTPDDWAALAFMASERLSHFGSVEGVPQGGLAFAEALRPYCTSGPVCIVDDVYTTGNSMRAQRGARDAIGVVAFARGPVEPWVFPLFTINEAFWGS